MNGKEFFIVAHDVRDFVKRRLHAVLSARFSTVHASSASSALSLFRDEYPKKVKKATELFVALCFQSEAAFHRGEKPLAIAFGNSILPSERAALMPLVRSLYEPLKESEYFVGKLHRKNGKQSEKKTGKQSTQSNSLHSSRRR